MEQSGFIQANVARLDPARLGRPLTLVVEVAVESERLDPLDAAKTRFAAAPKVQPCDDVTGEYAFVSPSAQLQEDFPRGRAHRRDGGAQQRDPVERGGVVGQRPAQR